MKRSSCTKKIGEVFICLVAVAVVAVAAYVLCRIHGIIQRQAEIVSSIVNVEGRLDLLEGNRGNLGKEIESSFNLADQVSASLDIIAIGIAVFTIFGGIFSVFNITRSKELEEAISKAEKAEENQKELIGARLLQEGLVYASRRRPYYAAKAFEKVIQEAPDTVAALTARYEILSLYADTKGVSLDSDRIQMVQGCFDELMSALDQIGGKIDHEICRHLRGDAYFTLGCTYGQFVSTHNPPDQCHIEASIGYLKKATQYSNEDVEYHKNLAYTYALAGKADWCKRELEFAIDYAEQEPLNKEHVSQKRLRALFSPIWHTLPIEFQEMLNKIFVAL